MDLVFYTDEACFFTQELGLARIGFTWNIKAWLYMDEIASSGIRVLGKVSHGWTMCFCKDEACFFTRELGLA